MQGAPGNARHERLGWLALAMTVVLAGLALRAWQFSLTDIGYSDELMQYLEQANRIVTGQGLIPWESRAGLRNALIPQLLAGPVWLGHAIAPGTLLAVGLARATFLLLTLIALPAAWRIGSYHSRGAALAALTVVSLWWESALFSQLLLSESLGAALVLAGAALLLDPEPRRARLAGAGLLLGLAVLVRLQYAPAAAVLALTALRADRARWVPVLGGAVLALVLGALSDLAAGAVPYGWAAVTVRLNLGEGIAARFGTLPADAYLTMLNTHLAPVGLAIGLAALCAPARLRPLLWAALANLVMHSLIGHKEYRFVWLTTLCLLVLAATGTVWLIERARGGRPAGLPQAALVCLGWALLSVWSAQVTGGAGAYRGGGAVARLADSAARDPRTCAIAFPFEYKSQLVPALLATPRPLLLIPEGVMTGRTAMPPAVTRAANALLLARGAGPAGYRLERCEPGAHGFPCLYRRPGTCAPAGAYGYQETLQRIGM
ncbi:hypothetical protein [Novosphingobium colocasiae]|uniref:hypothetical protein n=1 Tax=Novosphingobium colocasiae TaxID=1256513 RepID=UPI0035B49F88